MSLFVKIIISLVVAAIAAALTTWLAGDSHAALQLFIAFCAATIATALLVSIPAGSKKSESAASAPKTRRPSQPSASQARPSGGAEDAAREQGQVKWFNVSKGFGFITKDDGEEIFVHFRAIRGGGRRGLKDGQRVSFVVTQSDKGPQAEDVEGLGQD